MKIIKSISRIPSLSAISTIKLTDISSAKNTDSSLISDLTEDGAPEIIEITSVANLDSPVAWDAGFAIDGNKFRINGGVGPNGFGDCSITVPKDKALKAYNVEIRVIHDDSKIVCEYLDKCGIKYKLS